jgi:isocitrate lyase
MFDLAKHYAVEGMAAYVRVQRKEFEAEKEGYTTVKHQSFVGTEYFDEIATVISNGTSSTTAMDESTETAQFGEQKAVVTPPVRRLDPDHAGSQ